VHITAIDPQPNSYAQGSLVAEPSRIVYVSGQVPVAADGTVPVGFDEQCRLVWYKVLSVLREVGMTERDLVKVTVFLSDRRYREANARIRHEVLGHVNPALTVIITGVYDEAWLLEIEAVAAA
jgi:2-iminobutanoate/2-iminopropanoate deaminase